LLLVFAWVLSRAVLPGGLIAAPGDDAPGPADPSSLRQASSEDLDRLNRRIAQLFGEGRYRHAQALLKKVLELDPDNPYGWYNLACAHSRLNEVPQALICLHTSLDNGFTDFAHLQRDPDLAAVRAHAGFAAVVARKDGVQRARADRISAELKDRFGEDYLYDVDHENRLVFATNTDRRMLAELKEYLEAYAAAQWANLFRNRPDEYITVVIPKPSDFRSRRIGGYYNPTQRILVARTLGTTLTHEFTHALHAADLAALGQKHPIWLTEGLATLFENSRLVDGRVEIRPSRRLYVLKRALKRDRLHSWRKLMSMSQKDFVRTASVSYAQARSMLEYLHDHGKLQAFYEQYTAGFEQDATGAEAFEAVFDTSLRSIEGRWKRWLRSQKGPAVRLKPSQAYLGVQIAPVTDGLRIVRVIEGSGSAEAGLRAGDVIINVDNQRLADTAALVAFVGEREVGDRVVVEYRRGQEYRLTPVTLRAVPSRLP
jgi:tetratricopeptide (TPR) repeat protein